MPACLWADFNSKSKNLYEKLYGNNNIDCSGTDMSEEHVLRPVQDGWLSLRPGMACACTNVCINVA